MSQNENVCPRTLLFQIYEEKKEGDPKEQLIPVNGGLLM